MGKDLNRHITGIDTQIANKNLPMCSTFQSSEKQKQVSQIPFHTHEDTERLELTSPTTPNVGKDVRQLDLSYTLGRCVRQYNHFGKPYDSLFYCLIHMYPMIWQFYFYFPKTSENRSKKIYTNSSHMIFSYFCRFFFLLMNEYLLVKKISEVQQLFQLDFLLLQLNSNIIKFNTSFKTPGTPLSMLIKFFPSIHPSIYKHAETDVQNYVYKMFILIIPGR